MEQHGRATKLRMLLTNAGQRTSNDTKLEQLA
jgi:hypothetical protein